MYQAFCYKIFIEIDVGKIFCNKFNIFYTTPYGIRFNFNLHKVQNFQIYLQQCALYKVTIQAVDYDEGTSNLKFNFFAKKYFFWMKN